MMSMRQHAAYKFTKPVGKNFPQTRESIRHTKPASTNGKNTEHHQGNRHGPGCFVGVFRRVGAGFPQKNQGNLPHGIECRQQGSKCQCDEYRPMSTRERPGQDFILRPETRSQNRESGKCQPTRQKCPESAGHLFPKTAHVKHVLGIHMFTGM